MGDGGGNRRRVEEIVAAVTLCMALLFICTPLARDHLQRARAQECLAQRYEIERAEAAYRLEKRAASKNFAALAEAKLIAREPACPAGGVYVWLRRQPRPLLGCSIHDAPAPVRDDAPPLYAADFDDLSGLTILSGGWHTVNGVLVSRPGGENRLKFGETSWKDYEIRVNALLLEGDGYSIYYRADGRPDISGYCFQYHPGRGNKFLVRRVSGGVDQHPLQFADMPAGFAIYNQGHEISIAVRGDHHTIKIDDRTVLDFNDAAFASGAGGFQTRGRSEAYFDALSVRQR